MKKITAYILSIIIAFTQGIVSASNTTKETENEERVIFSSGFEYEDSALNSSVLYLDSKEQSIARKTEGYMQLQKNTVGTDPYFDIDLSSVNESIVFCADFKKGDSKITADLIKVRYTDNSMTTLLTLGSDGVVRCGQTDVTSLSTEKTTNIAVLLKKNAGFEIYINGEFKHSVEGKNLGWLFLRCQVLPDDFTGTIDIDNLKVFYSETYTENTENYIINKDFNDEKTFREGLLRITPGSGNSIDYKGNTSLVITTTDITKDPYIDISIPDSDTFSSLVFSADFTLEKIGTRTKIFQVRDINKNYLTDIYISENGELYRQSNKLKTLLENESVNIAVIYNVKESSYAIYINGEKRAIGENTVGTSVDRVRFQVMPNYGTGSLKIDNLRVYEGKALRETEDTDSLVGFSVLPGDKTDKIYFGEAVAYHTASDNGFYNGEKHTFTKRPFVRNGELYIPGEIAFPITGETQSGELSLKELCRDYQKELFYDKTGLIIITDGDFPYKDNEEVIFRLSTYLFSQRPDEPLIKTLFENSQNTGVHPRLLATRDDFDYFIREKDTSSYVADWIKKIIYRADNILITSPCEYNLQEFRLNAVTHIVLERIMELSFAYRVTGNELYAERAFQEMENAANYPDWNPQHFLDTAELTFAMAIGYDWCYEYLFKEGKTDIIEQAIVKKGLLEGDKQYRGRAVGTSFIFKDMNWNSVCNAGMCAGALAIIEKEPEYSCAIIKKSIRSLEYMLPAFTPDGAWQEGTGYWEYAFSYLVRMTKCLETSLGTDFGIPYFTGIENSLMYAIAMQGNLANNNYHDSSETGKIAPELLWAGDYFNNRNYTSYYLDYIQNTVQSDELYRCLYYDRETSGNSSFRFPNDVYLKNLEAVSMRDSYDNKNGVYLSFHAGKNDVNHRQYDAGAFVLDMLGERWASDLGTEPLSYLAHSANQLYRVRPEGHNTLVINPSQEIGQEEDADCPVTQFVSKEKGAYAVADLTSAYRNQADSVIRGFMLTDDRRTVVIRDEITLKEESDIYWFMHTKADISVEDENTAILAIGDKSLQLKVEASGGEALLYKAEAKPFEVSGGASGQADNSAYQKVAIKLTASSEASISVRITPLDEPFSQTEFAPKKISLWDIEDGKITYIPKDYDKEYIIHSELFDNEIKSPTDIYTFWKLPNGSGTIGGMIQSTKSSIVRQTGIGGKDISDGCVVVKTENLTGETGLDPFIQIECNSEQKDTVTFEFEAYVQGEQSLYIQLIDSTSRTTLLMEMKPDAIAYFQGGKVSVPREVWHDIAITIRGSKKTADIYLDGNLIAEGISAAIDVKRIKLISLFSKPTDTEERNGLSAFDNIRVYKGEKESYYYKLFLGGEETENPQDADEVYVKAADELKRKIYLAEYKADGSLTDINVINPGEEKRTKISALKKLKLFIWDKNSLYPKMKGITIGGKSNE